MGLKHCYHCGKKATATESTEEKLFFCCAGCEMVYRIIHKNDLGTFYTNYPQKGLTPKKERNYAFLANEALWKDCIQFQDGTKIRVKLSMHCMHCSACIWILEHLSHIEPAILHSHVTFSKRSVSLIFDTSKTSIKEIATLLDKLGYPPDFSVGKHNETQQHKRNRSLWLKMGIAGFAFGNSMFLALPTYFEKSEPWLDELRPWFDVFMFALSIPVVFYAARDYFIHPYKSISNKVWSLDIPIALGISVLFIKSTHAAFIAHELPYFYSLTGLVFFLLLGQYMQRSVYALADFERGYHSIFPVGVSVLKQDQTEHIVAVEDIKKKDCMLLRSEEIIPVDGIAISDKVHIDYSFVTGESAVVVKKKGDLVFAGGKIQKQIAIIQASKPMDKSFLIQLWQEGVSQKKQQAEKATFANRISRYFTLAILSISALSGIAWLFIDATRAVEVVVAVLIVACPYGRLQGVLLDSDSVVVAYDHVRGEKEKGRGKINRIEDRETSGKGDCIDCKLCVDVCPTGIDIRNGTQLECVNCTACIDACNEVMQKIDFPTHLIRYTSLRQIKQHSRFRWTTRLKAYSVLLSMLLGLFVFLVMSRSDIETGLFRIPGQLYSLKNETNSIQNVFTFKIANKTTHSIDSLHFVLLNQPKGTIYTVNKRSTLRIKAEEILDGTVFIELPEEAWLGKPQKLRVGVYHKEKLLDKAAIRFTGPRTYQ